MAIANPSQELLAGCALAADMLLASSRASRAALPLAPTVVTKASTTTSSFSSPRIANPSQELLAGCALAADMLLAKEGADLRYIEYGSAEPPGRDAPPRRFQRPLPLQSLLNLLPN